MPKLRLWWKDLFTRKRQRPERDEHSLDTDEAASTAVAPSAVVESVVEKEPLTDERPRHTDQAAHSVVAKDAPVPDTVAESIPEVEPATEELRKRMDRTAESILENEALTADLDDAAAQELLDWGLSCARTIAKSTAGLDDVAAEDAMYPRLRATRRLMRAVNRWVPKRQQMDAEGNIATWTSIIDQATVVYGDRFIPPGDGKRDAFFRHSLAVPSQQVVEDLRTLIENPDRKPVANQGEVDDKEKL